jgi:hypothetical protein
MPTSFCGVVDFVVTGFVLGHRSSTSMFKKIYSNRNSVIFGTGYRL